jgi:hypothetical protein
MIIIDPFKDFQDFQFEKKLKEIKNKIHHQYPNE